MKSTVRPTPLAQPVRYLVPAIAALALSWSSEAQAQTPLEQLNVILDRYAADATAPGKTPPTRDQVNASSVDLINAVNELLATNPALSPAQVITAALTPSNRPRSDRDKIAGLLVSNALASSDNLDDPAVVEAAVTAALGANLGTSGKNNVLIQALRNATGAGANIANAAKAAGLIVTDVKKQASFASTILKGVGTASGQVQDFTDRFLDEVAGDDEAFSIALAASVIKVPAVSGEVIGGHAANISVAADVRALADELISTQPKLAKATGEIVFNLAERYLTLNPAEGVLDFLGTGATGLATDTKNTAKGLIASGALRAAKAGESTPAILDRILTADPSTDRGQAVTDLYKFAAEAAIGNGNSNRAAEIVTDLIDNVVDPKGSSTRTVANKTKLTQGVITAISSSNPEAAQGIAAAAAVDASFNTPAGRSALAAALAKGSKVYAAAGSAVAGVIASIADPVQEQTEKTSIALAAVKASSRAAQAIAEKVSGVSTGDNDLQFAVALASGSSSSASGAIAAGVSLANIDLSGTIAAEVTKATTSTQSQAVKIATAVAAAVDVERIADVGQKVSSLFGDTSLTKIPKLTSVSALATALAKAINTKPQVTQTNRVDEIKELTASLALGVLPRVATLTSSTDQAKLLASIATGIFKAVGSKLYANAGTLAADIKDIAEGVAGSLALTIQNSSLPADVKTALLTAAGTGTTGLLAKTIAAAAKAYGGNVAVAIGKVRDGGDTSGYATGWIVDPETPIKNI